MTNQNMHLRSVRYDHNIHVQRSEEWLALGEVGMEKYM